MIAIITAGLSLGILGSFHCVGMCGPIALALPVHQYSTLKKYLGILLYNFGRALTYSLLGLILGILGQSFYLGGFQQVLSISVGTIILIGIAVSYTKLRSFGQFNFINHFIQGLKNKLGLLFGKKGLHVLFAIGMLNGLLPCGLVYVAFAGAIASGSYRDGALFMFSFGMGTIPAMFALGLFGQFISLHFRNIIRKSVPIFVSIMALLLIVRGLNLGIPYISPQFEKSSNTAQCCHKSGPAVKCTTIPHSQHKN